ncbi:tripartite tricarboxylate transporter substrate binding protein [Noviherbaspirillum sp. L7-7A]|uniref:Bug family tripartite tricarboxylate transporter substrate binding protein n=1 Tax=Noviherbaspirillum sp. L7-7A TaxID=2850560 RepID=UPI001C2C1A99|nr:tripartite tricarboxylate transporter substrate binding protein [Noviherbaspirillum sp. L7-7A]MBV0881448.1 tripartite tricarboxylate transporter substrate binding protein [Noviherbaspirillum sp. L7-7A]
MTILRRILAVTSLVVWSTCAFSQAYPSRPIKFVVPFPPGGGTDNLTRIIANELNESLKWTIVVENKPGAGGNAALDTTAKSAPDGHTLVMAQTDNVVLNPLLYSKLTYDPVKDLAPVVMVARGAAVLVVKGDSPYKTLADLVAAAKSKPGQLTFAIPGIGTTPHLLSEMWQKSSGIKLTNVPYKGLAQAVPDLIGGQVDMYMGSIPTLQAYIKSGKVRALAVTTAQRSPVLPDVPTYIETGASSVELSSIWGVMVPAGTPANIISRLNAEINKVLEKPVVREKIVASGAELMGGTPKAMADQYAADRAKLAPVVRASGTKLD